jgi:hypothetical protein
VFSGPARSKIPQRHPHHTRNRNILFRRRCLFGGNPADRVPQLAI